MRAIVTGGTGLLGRELLTRLPDAAVLTRDPARATVTLGGREALGWDPAAGPPAVDALAGAEVVFHLAGEPVANGRWTADRKLRIRESRVTGTRNLVAGLAAMKERPRVLVSASAVGYYGDRGDEVLDESSGPGGDFLAEVCGAWEREARAAEALGVRVVTVRIGLALAPGGGALSRMLTPFQLGAGGRLGNGRQWMSWAHIDDVVGILHHASQRDDLRGPVNAVSPRPVTNAEFTRALARAVHRPAFLPVPETALRLALGSMSEMVLGSQRVLPRVAERGGYSFRYPGLADALAAILAPRG